MMKMNNNGKSKYGWWVPKYLIEALEEISNDNESKVNDIQPSIPYTTYFSKSTYWEDPDTGDYIRRELNIKIED